MFKKREIKGVKSDNLESVKISSKEHEEIEYMNAIITEYQADGYTLSVRQLYYQLVARAYLENIVANYDKMSKFVTKARMAGLIDWSTIVDRTRVLHKPYYANSVSEAITDILNQFEVDRQLNQPNYVEIMCEKDALTGILEPVTKYYHIPLSVNKGYNSATAMYDCSNRFKAAIREGRECILLYFGDHDPSGLNMIKKDIPQRLQEFGVEPISIKHIALTTEQVARYKPPNNPAKISDTRYSEYQKEFGAHSWEVDALRPDVLDNLLHSEIKAVIDMNIFKERLTFEQEQRQILSEIAKR